MKRFYYKHIEAVLILGSLSILAVIVFALLENAYPLIGILFGCFLFWAGNKITKK